MATYPPPHTPHPHPSHPCGKWWPARHRRPFILPPLCCRSRQSKIRLVGQTGATYTSQRTVTHLEHSGKDFNTPNPSQTPPSLPHHHQLLFNYTLSCSRLRAWMPHVPSSRSARTDGGGQGVGEGSSSNTFSKNPACQCASQNENTEGIRPSASHAALPVAPSGPSRANLSRVGNWDVISAGAGTAPGIIQRSLATRFPQCWISALPSPVPPSPITAQD